MVSAFESSKDGSLNPVQAVADDPDDDDDSTVVSAFALRVSNTSEIEALIVCLLCWESLALTNLDLTNFKVFKADSKLPEPARSR